MQDTHGHIAIVGGGTAGWLAALVLARAVEKSRGAKPRISVIESPNIPTVGVGEGSTAIFRQVLLELGIEEKEFLRETGATLKFGIKHAGWRKDRRDYLGPIDDPNALRPPPPGVSSNWLHQAQLRVGKPVADAHLFALLMRSQKAAVYLDTSGALKPLSPFHHAYHFDQARLGRFLATKAKGITHIKAEIAGVRRDSASGRVTSLTCGDHPDIEVDFVIDCTGFRRAIIGQLGARWVSYGDSLPLNRAMPFWLDHANGHLPPYTLAQALGAGWMWGIPVQDRMGCGYVFSDAHLSAEQAHAEVEAHLGRSIEPRGLIKIDPGRLQTAWVQNCVALGLAQSFLEPLEATSIHGTLVQLLLLTGLPLDRLLAQTSHHEQERYNTTVARQIDDFASFINLHYAGGRQDTPFWQDMTHSGITPENQQRIEDWSITPLDRSQFKPFPGGLPHVEEQLFVPVLDGLGLMTPGAAKAALPNGSADLRRARKTIEVLRRENLRAAKRALGHVDYISMIL